jgi:hypothetical protein
MIIGSFGAGLIYIYKHMYGSAIYWITAALLNISVTYLIKRFG